MRTAILSVASGGWYPEGQRRLGRSLDAVGYTGDRLFWSDTIPATAPQHKDIPYAFKPHAFYEARGKGYDVVLWVDAAVWAIKPLDSVFAHIEKYGYLLFVNGPPVGEWCSDQALGPLRLTREEAFLTPQIMACVMGLDFRTPAANRFLDEWIELANDGVTFPGPWTNENGQASTDPRVKGHRHDQTAASVVAHRLGMRDWLISQETFLLYHSDGCVPRDTVCLLTRGM